MIPGVLIRCDGGKITLSGKRSDLASGHLMRMLNFALAWREMGGKVWLASNKSCEGIEPLLQRYRDGGCEVLQTSASSGDSLEDAREVVDLAKAVGAGAVYLDGYHFDSRYQAVVHAGGLPLLFQDDTGTLGPYLVDFIVGSHMQAPFLRYDSPWPTQKLLGPKFAFLSRDFSLVRRQPRAVPTISRRLLVTFGGSDAFGDTQKCLRGLRQMSSEAKVDDWLSHLEVTVVIGASNKAQEEIQELADDLFDSRGCRVRILRDIRNMAEIMGWADIAFTAAGGTVLELMCLGVPMAIQVTHPIQGPIAARMLDGGVCRLVGASHALDTSGAKEMGRIIAQELFNLGHDQATRENMSRRGRELVDGAGAQRVCEALISHLAKNSD